MKIEIDLITLEEIEKTIITNCSKYLIEKIEGYKISGKNLNEYREIFNQTKQQLVENFIPNNYLNLSVYQLAFLFCDSYKLIKFLEKTYYTTLDVEIDFFHSSLKNYFTRYLTYVVVNFFKLLNFDAQKSLTHEKLINYVKETAEKILCKI